MNFYPENYTVEITVPFTDKNGAVIVPLQISAMLFDGEDIVLIDFGSLTVVPASTSKIISINAAFNTLGVDEVRSARVLQVDLTTAAGVVTKILSYVVEAEQTLLIMNNTFQSFAAAEILSLTTASSQAWLSADEVRQRAALSEAFRRLTNIPMRYSFRDDLGNLLISEEKLIERDQWSGINKDAFDAFPAHFKRALRQAQFLEANEILQGDAVASRHRSGIISETIGESSVTLRAGRIDWGIGSLTMNALAGYIYFNMRIARA